MSQEKVDVIVIGGGLSGAYVNSYLNHDIVRNYLNDNMLVFHFNKLLP